MAPETQAPRETQEQSIKARKNELFEEEREDPGGPRRPFRAYLQDTPATPMSVGVKASLWGTGAVVGLLFVGAIAGGHETRATAPTGSVIPSTSQPVAKTAPAPAVVPKEEKKDEKTVANASKPEPPADAKPKERKPKSKSRPKPKPPQPENSALAKNAPSPSAPASNEPARNAPGNLSAAGGQVPANASDATSKPAPKKKTSILFKKPKPYNPAYPKRGDKPSEKKDEMPDPSSP